jgi:hypothetical protein
VTTPTVIQRSRKKGTKLVSPNGLPTDCVSRPSVFGNPFPAKDAEAAGYPDGATMAVWAFRVWLGLESSEDCHEIRDAYPLQREALLQQLPTLQGKNLACWCEVGKPCHAAVLLEIANRQEPMQS